jgi:peptide/nickel transport system substrate-binding protein
LKGKAQLLAVVFVLAFSFAATAKELVIGLQAAVTSIDPHYHNLTPNISLHKHIYEPLVDQDANQKLIPGLATSWKVIDDRTWEFQLRKGVKWHDGSDFTAEDVAYSIKRAPSVPNSPSSFAPYVKQIKEVIIKDPYTIQLKTEKAYPLMPNDMSVLLIVSKKNGENAITADYNSGKAAIGTGPYKFSQYVSGDRVVLDANENYWRGREPWDKVTFKIIANSAARVSALLAGDVQVIEAVPTADAAQLQKNKDVDLFDKISNRVIYLHIDSGREKNSPTVTDKSGKPLEANPLRDVRVRRAISKAINREAIATRIMEGKAIPAGQLLPDGFFGVSAKLKVEKYDPEGAKKLLAEAGYPNGFGITIHGPSNRYINDEKIAQSIAQMLSRIGIDTKVETMPANVYFTRASKLEFSLMLLGWGAGTGEMSDPLKALIHTFDQGLGYGGTNRGRYSNPQVDSLITTALSTIDDHNRELALQQAVELAINDIAVIPLHYEVSTWAARKGLTYAPRTDQYTFAMSVRPVKK